MQASHSTSKPGAKYSAVSMDGNDEGNDPRPRQISGTKSVDASSSSSAPESYSDKAVLSFSQIHRSHTQRQSRPENTGALSSHPRLDRDILRLCQRYEKNGDALTALRVQDDGTDPSGRALELARLQKQRKKLASRLQECVNLLQPDFSGTVMERIKSPATVELENRFKHVWSDYQQTQRDSYTKYLWTVASGGIAYSIPFGTGTMLARGLEIPYLVLLAGPLHTLAEPVWTMVRATTWTNPASETYVGRQRARARAHGDAWRYLAHIPPKAKMLWQDPQTGAYSRLTAAQALATNQELWLWVHKVVTDDVPFLVFSILYAAKNALSEAFGPDFYNHAVPGGMRNDLAIQFAAGFASGALAMLLSQALRRAISGATQGQQLVTKSLHIWALEARYLKAYLEDIEEALSRTNLPAGDAGQLRRLKAEITAQHAKAHAKSGLFTSIGHELGVMFQEKREATGTDPDMPGKRLDTACSILGKSTSLLPALLATRLCQPFASSGSLMERMIAYTVPAFALVVWPGFAMRTEWQDAWRSLYGAGKGMISAMRAGCCCAPEEEAGEASSMDDSTESEEAEEDDLAHSDKAHVERDNSDDDSSDNDHVITIPAIKPVEETSSSSDRVGTVSDTGTESDSESDTKSCSDSDSDSEPESDSASSSSSDDSGTSSRSTQDSRSDTSTRSYSHSRSIDENA